ncbi:hypothetical protein BACCIP111883_01136 [Sutcliffiella rhizosphaerae]|uniref:Uncharacterized protein n=1 Tax=Sutcliffiella rhizosphaerae TaxID=2880967 RepID=A0ABM8YKH8_9BACI|nr:hypothetical protein BACCIP111883_01136 [Sutcliffiella rhizosphaerae]
MKRKDHLFKIFLFYLLNIITIIADDKVNLIEIVRELTSKPKPLNFESFPQIKKLWDDYKHLRRKIKISIIVRNNKYEKMPRNLFSEQFLYDQLSISTSNHRSKGSEYEVQFLLQFILLDL